jgi:hypothetical protein
MRLLFVALEFPPLAGIGVRRSLQLARRLPEFGVSPVVLTTDAASYPALSSDRVDLSTVDQIPPGIVVERIPCPSPYAPNPSRLVDWYRTYFGVVDATGKWWKPEVTRALSDILTRHRPEVIYVSVPPFGTAPLWCDIGKQVGLPVVLDFRDAWSQWCVGPYGSWLHYRLALRLERRCLNAAARVICSSDQIRSDFLAVHPTLPPEKLVTITNGYDDDVADWSIPEPNARAPFVIGYVGSFYYSPASREAMMTPWWRKRPNRMIQYSPRKEDWLYRSPYFFFRAVRCLLDARPDLCSRLRIRFAGKKPDWIDQQVRSFGLEDLVEFAGLLGHQQALEFQSECDCLLVTSSKVIGGRDYSIAGKTYEYFTRHRPILGFACEGAQKDMLERSGMAVVCDPDDPTGSAARMAELIDGRLKLTPDPLFLIGLHRRELTRAIADLLREVVGQASAAAPLVLESY